MGKSNLNTCRYFLYKTGESAIDTLITVPFLSLNSGYTSRSREYEIKHFLVAGQHGRFFGWPANNGMWKWNSHPAPVTS